VGFLSLWLGSQSPLLLRGAAVTGEQRGRQNSAVGLSCLSAPIPCGGRELQPVAIALVIAREIEDRAAMLDIVLKPGPERALERDFRCSGRRDIVRKGLVSVRP
jgi:hypothetical protein